MYQCTRDSKLVESLHVMLTTYLAGLCHSSPRCLLMVYRCTLTHSPHPPWPSHLSPAGLITLHWCVRPCYLEFKNNPFLNQAGEEGGDGGAAAMMMNH